MERIAVTLGHRFPNNRIIKTLCYRAGVAMNARSRETRVAQLFDGNCLRIFVDDPLLRTIYFFGTYEEDVTRLIQRLAGPGQTWLDVGANVGFFTVMLSRLVGAGGKVFAFEPNPPVADLIKESIEMNRLANVTLMRAAVGPESGKELTLYVPTEVGPTEGGYGRPSLVPQQDFTASEEVWVPVIALDDFIHERGLQVDFMKIDVEGYEHLALEGMKQTLTEHPPKVIIGEVSHRPECLLPPKELIAYIAGYGYTPFEIKDDGLYRYTDDQEPEAMNFAFVQSRHLDIVSSLIVKK